MIKLMALLLTLILTACAQTSMLDVKQAPPPAVAPARNRYTLPWRPGSGRTAR